MNRSMIQKSKSYTIHIITVISCCLCLALTGTFAYAEDIMPTYEDVSYYDSSVGIPEGVMDLYVPNNPKRTFIFVHGGSWVGGDKENLWIHSQLMLQWLLDRDYMVAALNFRKANPPPGRKVVTYVEMVTDVAHAVAWLKSNSSNYGVTNSEPILLGYSSGGHLVSLLVTDQSYLQSAGLISENIAAIISMDIHAYDVPYAIELMKDSEIEHLISRTEWIFDKNSKKQLEGSPSNYVSEDINVPPILIVSTSLTGTDPDSTDLRTGGEIVESAGRSFANLLSNATHVHFDELNHVTLIELFGKDDHGATKAVEEFLDGLGL